MAEQASQQRWCAPAKGSFRSGIRVDEGAPKPEDTQRKVWLVITRSSASQSRAKDRDEQGLGGRRRIAAVGGGYSRRRTIGGSHGLGTRGRISKEQSLDSVDKKYSCFLRSCYIDRDQLRTAEEFAAALAASKGLPPQTDPDGVLNSQTGLSVGTPGQYAPAIAGGQPWPTGTAPQPVPLGTGLDIHGYDDEEMIKLRAERGGKAGGWSIELSKKRAIEEAFGSVWI
ncbi:hypothetical protein NL676_009757 [Syzygium grande]|nr:hypothetical protein NL676_009757 [Syzygium grande]